MSVQRALARTSSDTTAPVDHLCSPVADGPERRPIGAAARSRRTNQLLGSIGGNTYQAGLDSEGRLAHTQAARAAGPGSLEYYFDQVDPDRSMSEAERIRSAQNAKRAYFSRLALASAKARSRKAPPPADEAPAALETSAK